MHASFARKQAVGIFAAELNRGVLDARFFAGRFVEQIRAEAFALRPAQIHAQQNRSPILRLGATGAGLDGHDGVEVIVFAGESVCVSSSLTIGIRGGQFAVQILQQIFFLLGVGFALGEFDVRFEVAGERRELFVGGTAELPRACARAGRSCASS